MSDKTNELSRREFLKAAGLATSGIAMGSLGLFAACRNETTGVSDTSISEIPTLTDTPAISTSTPTSVSSPIVATTSSTATPIFATSSTIPSTMPTVPPSDLYVPPAEYPPLLAERYGCDSYVAADRWYTIEHTWVKELGDGKVVVGVTDKMQFIMSTITRLSFIFGVGAVVDRGFVLAAVEAHKLNTDILVPVSGKILQVNTILQALPDQGINIYPYTKGWLAVIQLSKPQEMDELIGPNYYAYLQAVRIPPTAPPMRS